jgi:hypothetical protein
MTPRVTNILDIIATGRRDNGSTLRLSATPILRETSAASSSETSQFSIFGDAVNFGSANARSVVARMVPG